MLLNSNVSLPEDNVKCMSLQLSSYFMRPRVEKGRKVPSVMVRHRKRMQMHVCIGSTGEINTNSLILHYNSDHRLT